MYSKFRHKRECQKKRIEPLKPLNFQQSKCFFTFVQNYTFWKQLEEHLLRLPQKNLRHKHYYMTKKDPRLTGCFPRQRANLKVDIIRRRGAGIPCSTTWIGHRMFQICCKDMPEGFDPSNKNQFNKTWIDRFMGHEDLSVGLRTNKKKKVFSSECIKFMGFIGKRNTKWLSRIFHPKKKVLYLTMKKVLKMKKKKTRLPLHRNRLNLQRIHHRDLGLANQRKIHLKKRIEPLKPLNWPFPLMPKLTVVPAQEKHIYE